MLTAAEITAGSSRLTANKLKTSDQETLLSLFRLYLKSAAEDFDIADKLAALTDSGEVKTAAKLAAILIKIEETGFGVAELVGDRSGLKFREMDEISLQIRFAFALLYNSPESFSGSIESSGEATSGNTSSGAVPLMIGW